MGGTEYKELPLYIVYFTTTSNTRHKTIALSSDNLGSNCELPEKALSSIQTHFDDPSLQVFSGRLDSLIGNDNPQIMLRSTGCLSATHPYFSSIKAEHSPISRKKICTGVLGPTRSNLITDWVLQHVGRIQCGAFVFLGPYQQRLSDLVPQSLVVAGFKVMFELTNPTTQMNPTSTTALSSGKTDEQFEASCPKRMKTSDPNNSKLASILFDDIII